LRGDADGGCTFHQCAAHPDRGRTARFAAYSADAGWRHPEDPKAATAPVKEGYWEERTRRELENMERVAADNKPKFLDPHGLRTKADFWDKDE